jgi:hypothetical protein
MSRTVAAQSGGSLAAVAATQSTAVAGVPRQSASSPCSPRCRDVTGQSRHEKGLPASGVRQSIPPGDSPRNRRSAPKSTYFSSWRAITIRWIWLVPS